MGGNKSVWKLATREEADYKTLSESPWDFIHRHIDLNRNNTFIIDFSAEIYKSLYTHPHLFATLFMESSNSTAFDVALTEIAECVAQRLHCIFGHAENTHLIVLDGKTTAANKPAIVERRAKYLLKRNELILRILNGIISLI